MNRQQRRKCKNTYEMARRIENELDTKARNYYEQEYKKQLDKAIEIFIIAIKYTLHFNEKTKFGNERIKDFMEDLLSTVDMFRTRRIQS